MATFVEALQHARGLLSAGRLAEAEPVYGQLLQAAPQVVELWHEMGVLQIQMGRADAARQCFERAIQLDGRNPALHSNLGAVHRLLQRPQDAAACFRRAMQLAGPSAELLNNLALALKDSNQPSTALDAFDEALRLRPDYANGHFNRANLFSELGRLEEAIASYSRALELQPGDAGAFCRLGTAYYDLAQYDQALACFDRALQLKPDYAEARRNRGIIWLGRGEYQRGWKEFEARAECDGFNPPRFEQPRWDGSPLAGQRLLVWSEQGLGDTLQFIRYLPLAEQGGAAVRAVVQPALVPLLQQSGFTRYLATAEANDFDLHCPLLSLPRYLPDGTGAPYWPGQPYLAADPERIARWAPRIAALPGLKVGICWAGNPQHPHDRFRSAPLECFAPLAQVPGVTLVSLQKSAAQAAALAQGFPLLDLDPELDATGGAFLDTAAVIAHLDLVISVDTSLAHLAGALGARIWVPLQLSPDWRWTLAGESTPWYPTMRLFRQRAFDQWQPVFAELAASLAAFPDENR